MDDRQVGARGDVVGEYVGTVASYEPAVRAATVRLRAPVPSGAKVRISSASAEWDERLRVRQRLLRRNKLAPAEEDVVIRVQRPVEVGADVFRLWTAA